MKKYLITLLLLTGVIFQTQLFSYSGEIIGDTKCSEINNETRYGNLSPIIITKIDEIGDRINEKYKEKDNVYKEKIYNLFEKVLNEHLQKTTYSGVQKEVLLRIGDYFVCKKENLIEVEQEVINDFIYVNNIGVKVSEYQLENKPENTLDNNLSTRWSADGIGQWIEYDLKTIKKIYGLDIATYVGSTRVFTFDVLISLDGETYTKQLNKKETSGTTLNLEKHIFETELEARYIKIVGYGNTQSTWNSVTEVKFIETEEEAIIKVEEEAKEEVEVSEEESEDYSDILGKKIFEVNFSSHPVGDYTVEMQKQDFHTYEGENLHYNNHDGSNMIGDSRSKDSVSIVTDDGENVLDIFYKAGEIGYSDSGFLIVNALPKNNRLAEDVNNPTEITLVYYVKFEGNFEWSYGGKLPGLSGGVIPSGGKIISSYDMENGFSARFMWELMWDNDGQPQGLKPYVYHPGRVGTVGELVYGKGPFLSTIDPQTSLYSNDTSSGFIPKKDRWYKITQTIKANTPNKSDGFMKVWIDDIFAADLGDMKYIADGKSGDYTVDRLCFSTFYGGGSSSWAPTRDTHIRFKDFSIYEK